ncbi:MAG: hypothetical protein ACN4GZ_19325, partial [Acidimicrobiales bacterium]
MTILAFGLIAAACGSDNDSSTPTSQIAAETTLFANADTASAEVASTGGDQGFAEPAEAFDRLVDLEGPCPSGFVSIDGLYEFANVDGELRRLDLLTKEITSHGPEPLECAMWFGDEERDQRVALPLVADRAWFGTFDGPFETEVVFDSPAILLSRTFAANRLLFFEFENNRLILRDATTGKAVGEPITGGFAGGRDFSSNAVNAKETLLAIGGANPGGAGGDGLIFVLDPASGEELFQVDVLSPVTTLVFDDDTQELIVGSFTGELY